MYEYMQSAENAANQIAELYYRASRYLSYKAEDIFEKYKTKYGLSEAEAKRLINTLRDKTSIDELLQKLQNAGANTDKEELLKELEAPAYQARIERLRQLQNELDLVMQSVYKQEKSFNTNFYVDLANEAYYKQIFNIQQQADAAFSFNYIDAKQIDRMINSKWSGKNYSSRIWENTKQLSKTLKEELLLSFVTGRTNHETAQVITNKFGQGASNARRLIQTESNYVSSEMNFAAYTECGIKEYRFLATLDLRTSKKCRELDGKIFLVKDRKIGVNCNPMHPWCRSTTISVIRRELLDKLTRSAIDPSTGKRIKVPLTMTYQQWYDKYVKGNPKAKLEEKKIKNRSSDRKQHKKYREILGEKIPEKLDDFQDMKYNDIEKWTELKNNYRVVNQYEVISGQLKPSDIVRLDKRFESEKLNFSSRLKNQGNIAIAEFNGTDYIAHSKVRNELSRDYSGYKGKSQFVFESPDRVFKTKVLPSTGGWDRKVDGEAKIFEYINSICQTEKKPNVLNMMTKYPMCESCLDVMSQFKNKNPEIKVNIIQRKVTKIENEK